MEDERFVIQDLDQLGQILHALLDVDIGVPRVPEDPEEPVDPDVDARRLDQLLVEGVDSDPPLGEQSADRTVGENHRGQSIS